MQNVTLNSVRAEMEVLTRNWKTVLLGEVFNFTKKPGELRFSNYEYIPFVPMEYIPIGSTYFNQFELKAIADISSGTYFEPGDILLAKITPSFENGKQGIIEDLPIPFGIATTEVIPIKEIDGISNKHYLFYYLLRHDIRSMLAGKMEGSTGRQRLSITTLANLVISFPPLPEQRVIAHILQTVQQTIQARRKELELERERKTALMQYLFTHGTRNEPTKQSEVGEIPESWRVAKLADHIYRPSYGYTASAIQKPIGPRFLRITDIQNLNVDWSKVPYCSCSENEKQQYLLENGDIVVARIGATTGKAFLIRDCPEALFASYLMRIRVKDSLKADFLHYFFQTNVYWQQINKQKGGKLKEGINIPILEGLLIPFPYSRLNLSEQETIAEVLYQCDNKIAALEKEITLHEELFRALLDELMTGRISTLPLVEELEKGTLTNGQRTPDGTGTTD